MKKRKAEMTIAEYKELSEKKHKYKAKPTVVNGIRFGSAKEARRYTELALLANQKQISGLELQVRYKIVIESVYVADFRYRDHKTGNIVVEDVKGFKTREYKRKKRLMREQHGIEILET
jgi:hypothetical protein